MSCYSTARMNRALFPEAGAEASDTGAEQEAETRGLDTFGGCLSSLTRYETMIKLLTSSLHTNVSDISKLYMNCDYFLHLYFIFKSLKKV